MNREQSEALHHAAFYVAECVERGYISAPMIARLRTALDRYGPDRCSDAAPIAETEAIIAHTARPHEPVQRINPV